MSEIQDVLRVICLDLPSPPLFWRDESGKRVGYESDVARLLAAELGVEVEFIYRSWDKFYSELDGGAGDIILCGQGISEHRRKLGDFSESYAVFDESILVRSDSEIHSAEDLQGKRVGAIANSLNMALAESFSGAICIPFNGDSDDVLDEMVDSVRSGYIDALVDDDVVLVPLLQDKDLSIAFKVPTQNHWGIVVSKSRPALLVKINQALANIKENGSLRNAWEKWMPSLTYPYGSCD